MPDGTVSKMNNGSVCGCFIACMCKVVSLIKLDQKYVLHDSLLR